jgi:hypothetical protein
VGLDAEFRAVAAKNAPLFAAREHPGIALAQGLENLGHRMTKTTVRAQESMGRTLFAAS